MPFPLVEPEPAPSGHVNGVLNGKVSEERPQRPIGDDGYDYGVTQGFQQLMTTGRIGSDEYRLSIGRYGAPFEAYEDFARECRDCQAGVRAFV